MASAIIMSTIEALMRRMNWHEDQTKWVGIIVAVAALSIAGTVVLVYLYFSRVVAMLRRRWVMWTMGFRRKEHGDIEYFEFEETTGSDHGGTNSRRVSACGESVAETDADADDSPVS